MKVQEDIQEAKGYRREVGKRQVRNREESSNMNDT